MPSSMPMPYSMAHSTLCYALGYGAALMLPYHGVACPRCWVGMPYPLPYRGYF